MIHPNPGNTVAVCNKVTVPIADNGGICPVNTYTAEIFGNHFTYIFWIHKKQGETILP